jgi:argonaute-like protein implicated in RNA metabolism and viral defense
MKETNKDLVGMIRNYEGIKKELKHKEEEIGKLRNGLKNMEQVIIQAAITQNKVSLHTDSYEYKLVCHLQKRTPRQEKKDGK